ncbi:MAG TPA: porphobilinogen synthase [Planctomycetota bacterium]|jgi:porphobilinogen synthase|nr:porphobilinogen synthase [Planctomycetota bacterium]
MASKASAFLKRRARRTRATPGLRGLVRETRVGREDLIVPLFVREGREDRRPIASMPGQFQFSVKQLAVEAKEIAARGLPAVLLFGIPAKKDARGSGAWARNGIIPRAVKAVKDAAPGIVVLTDVCLCEYTDHGHCGIVTRRGGSWRIENDATLPLLARTASAHAAAGADIVAPSGMMDGAVGAIRAALPHAPILSYAAKYASSFYGPFRDAAESPPQFGDRSSYQMDPANGDEAMREIAQDLDEGADAIMVKPALAYLDIVRRARERFDVPLAAYNVSGEYAMIKAGAERGWIDERKAVLELLTGIRRAGADFIVTYHARAVSDLLL